MLSLGDGKVHALLCGSKVTGMKVICVNAAESDVLVSNAFKSGAMPVKVPLSFTIPAMSVTVY